jgi:hypothetical protein
MDKAEQGFRRKKMNFKRNILGLAVAVGVASVSVTAISDEIPTPTAFVGVDTTALAGTEAALNGKAEYTTVESARNDSIAAAATLTTALKVQAAKNKQISDAQAAIAAANALTAGQLIGGQTKAEIVAAQNTALGQSAAGVPDGTGFLNDVIALNAGVVTATTAAAKKAATLTAIRGGVISNQFDLADAYQDAAAAQATANGTVAAGSAADTLGLTLYTAETNLGAAAVVGGAPASGLYADVVTANAAVVAAKAQAATDGAVGTDVYAAAAGSVAAATPGVKSVSTFSIADTNVLDLRDGDTQLTFTVGTTAVNNEAALLAAINAETGFSFTATGDGAGAITLTYDDADNAIEGYSVWTAAKIAAREAVLKIGGVATAVGTTVGTTYVAANVITYDVNVANKELLASQAAAALQVGIATEQLAQANYDAGVAAKAAHIAAETAAYKATATLYTSVDSVLQEKLNQQNIVVAGNEVAAQTAEAAAAEDLADVTSTAATLATATATETQAAADVAAAQAAYTATGGATAANLATLNAATTAKTAATAAKNTAATAATAATDAYYGAGLTAATAVASQNGTNAAALSARTTVVNSTKVATGIDAQRALQVQIAADAANPAAVLQTALVAGSDTGGAVVAAVNTNHQATKVNAEGIAANVATLAVHEGLVTTNIANIATNTTNIATNTADIATNTADIATNTAGIATNAANIVDLDNGLTEGMANLQRVEMQMNENVDMLKSGIASALAIAGMPTAPGEGMGFSVGTGYFDGESAVAMGLTFVDGSRSYKLSLGHSGGETSASAGAAFKF